MPAGSEAAQLRVEHARKQHGPALAALFERVDCPCYCRYWDFPGDARSWQARCAMDRETSRRELLDTLPERGDTTSADSLRGLVALADAGTTCLGWMRLESPARMSKAYEGRLYRGLPCLSGSRTGVLTVACFLVDDSWRRLGVATRLLEEGITWARRWGAHTLEAFPRRAENVTDEEHWMGPPALFEKFGFVVIHQTGPYPVMQRAL